MPRKSLIRNGAALLTTLTCATSLALVSSESTASATKSPNLLVVGASVDRAMVAEGATIAVTHRVRNSGRVKAAASQTRFYLTLDAAASIAARKASRTNPRSSATDVRLVGVRPVAALAPGKLSPITTTRVTVPVGVAPGSYRVLVCADDRGIVRETSEVDNCAVASRAVAVSAAPRSDQLRLQQFADTARWNPDDDAFDLQWMKSFCQSTVAPRALTAAGALASITTYLETRTDAGTLQQLATSGLVDNAVEAQQVAAAAVTQGSPGLAMAALLRARAFEPKIGTHLVNLAALSTSVGLPNEALALLDGALGLDTRRTPLGLNPQAGALAVRGQALVMTGRLAAARSVYASLRRAEPLLSEADAGLAVIEACSGNDALALRYARLSRQRTDEPRTPTENPATPEPARPEPAIDLSQGEVTFLRQLTLAETPAQGVVMRDVYHDIAQGFIAEIDADNAEAQAIDERLAAVDTVITRAERQRRDDITTFAYRVGQDDRVADLQDVVFDLLTELTEHKEGFWGGGTGEAEFTYGTLTDEANATCAGRKDYQACYDARINETCRPELSTAHNQWKQLMGELQNAADEWMIEASSLMSAYAANLADPDAHRRILLQIEVLEQGMYGLLVQQAQQWTHFERLFEVECVQPHEAEVLDPADDVTAASKGGCAGPLDKMTFVAGFGPSKVKVECEKVTQEFSAEVLPFVHAFAEISYDFRTGKVTLFAGSKLSGKVGVVEGAFKSGIYVETDSQGGVSDTGWRVGPSVEAGSGPLEVGVFKDEIDISFIPAPSTKP